VDITTAIVKIDCPADFFADLPMEFNTATVLHPDIQS